MIHGFTSWVSIFSTVFSVWGSGSPRMHGHYLNCILVETTLCDIIFMHYVLNIIYQLYGEDNASILTFLTLTLKA